MIFLFARTTYIFFYFVFLCGRRAKVNKVMMGDGGNCQVGEFLASAVNFVLPLIGERDGI
jgi:hypothetical protein